MYSSQVSKMMWLQAKQQAANLKEPSSPMLKHCATPEGNDNPCQTSCCFVIFWKPLQNALKEGCVQHLASCFPSAKAQLEEVSKRSALIRTPGMQRQTLCPYSWNVVQKCCKRSDSVLLFGKSSWPKITRYEPKRSQRASRSFRVYSTGPFSIKPQVEKQQLWHADPDESLSKITHTRLISSSLQLWSSDAKNLAATTMPQKEFAGLVHFQWKLASS